MNDFFRPYLDSFVLIYLDDIPIYSKTKQEHVEHLKIVLQKLRENKLDGKMSKCEFFKSQIQYLGHVITESVIQVDDSKITSVRDWEPRQDVTQVQVLLGLLQLLS